MLTLLKLVALEVVIKKIADTTSDDEVGIMMTLGFQGYLPHSEVHILPVCSVIVLAERISAGISLDLLLVHWGLFQRSWS